MIGKKVVTTKYEINYKFHINDPVKIVKGTNINNSIIKSRYNVSGVNHYKVGNSTETRICKETELINR